MTDQQGSPTLGKVAPWTRLEAELAGLDKLMLEVHYRNRAVSYFGKHLRRVQVVSPAELDELLGDILSLSDLGQVLDLDLVVAGTLRESPGPQSWLAVEISPVIEESDVERARDGAAILRRAGRPSIPTVAGRRLAPGVATRAADEHVLVVEDGRHHGWPEALAAVQPRA